MKTKKEKIAEIESRKSFTPEEKALRIRMLDFEDLLSRFESDKSAKRKAKELLEKYLTDYEIETEADKGTLSNLIYLEVIGSRLQDKADETYETTKAVSMQFLDAIHENLEKIQKLKDQLGLNKKDSGESNPAQIFYDLQTKIRKYLEENGAGHDFCCPHCHKFARLVLRMDSYIALKHPFIGRDRVIFNPWLTKLYAEGKITKLDYARILDVAEDGIDELMRKHGKGILKEIEIEENRKLGQ